MTTIRWAAGEALRTGDKGNFSRETLPQVIATDGFFRTLTWFCKEVESNLNRSLRLQTFMWLLVLRNFGVRERSVANEKDVPSGI